MIRRCNDADFEAIYEIINDAAMAYEGVIPSDAWADPYMSREELRRGIADGIVFWSCEMDGELAGVMGIQDVQDVTLIRHSYVRTAKRNQGIGGKLLSHLRDLTPRPVLVGTWADAAWAVRFYEHHGFRLVSPEEKDRLVRRYWSVPERQIETSVVLADERWQHRAGAAAASGRRGHGNRRRAPITGRAAGGLQQGPARISGGQHSRPG